MWKKCKVGRLQIGARLSAAERHYGWSVDVCECSRPDEVGSGLASLNVCSDLVADSSSLVGATNLVQFDVSSFPSQH